MSNSLFIFYPFFYENRNRRQRSEKLNFFFFSGRDTLLLGAAVEEREAVKEHAIDYHATVLGNASRRNDRKAALW